MDREEGSLPVKLHQCVNCGEVQRNIFTECIVCDEQNFQDAEPPIEGWSISELYERWKARGVLDMYDDGQKDYFEVIDWYLINERLEEYPIFCQKEIEDIKEFLKLYNENNIEIYGKGDDVTETLLQAKSDSALFWLLRGKAFYFSEV